MDTEEQITQETEEPAEVSNETEPVSEEPEEVKPITFTTQAELDEYIKKAATPLAQSMKDKELKSAWDEVQALKKESASLKRQMEYKADDSKLAKQEALELAQLGDTEEVKELQDVRRDVIKIGRENKIREKELADKEEHLTSVELKQNAFEKALKLFLPEDKGFITEIEAFTNRLQEATTQREMDLIYSMEEARIKAKAEAPKPKRPKPDLNTPSAPSGTFAGTPAELIADGLKREKLKIK